MSYDWQPETDAKSVETKLLAIRSGVHCRGMGYPVATPIHTDNIFLIPNEPQRSHVIAYMQHCERKVIHKETTFT